MQLMTCAKFWAAFPDDCIEEDGDIVLFPGQVVAQAMADILTGFGFKVTSPEHQAEHGWDFDVHTQSERIWFQVCAFNYDELGHECWLCTKCHGNLFRPWKKREAYADVLTRLNAAMVDDPRFTKIRWMRLNEVPADVPGSSTPVLG
jgi:hypothetical protein